MIFIYQIYYFIHSEIKLEQNMVDPVNEENKIPLTTTESNIKNGEKR